MRISNPDPNQKPNKALGYLFLFGIVFALGRCGVMGIYERTDPSGIAEREAIVETVTKNSIMTEEKRKMKNQLEKQGINS
jgi:hypothetical protein